MKTVAALYVDPARGPYAGTPGVDAWGVERDARLYAGPHPVVAHPPCAAWGKFGWRASKGEADCGPRAVAQVRAWGGVLEHPKGSRLWKACGLPPPGSANLDAWGGMTLEIRQCDWGHDAEKATWLYVCRLHSKKYIILPPRREPSHVIEPARKTSDMPRLEKRRRHLTPPALASWLVDLARHCG
jgi:hypothetical protein